MNTGEVYISLGDYAPGIKKAERVANSQAHSFTPLLSTLAGDDWRKGSEGIFTQVWTNGDSPQGQAAFKIRLAANSVIADDVLRAAVPIIIEAGCPFKVIANTGLLELAGAKCPSDDPAGDFLTVFPPSQAVFDDLAGNLRQAVQGIKSSPPTKPSDETGSREPLSSENPWPGLDYYLPAESAFYFGREEDQRAVAQQLERGIVSVVVGQSHFGSSSFVRAGLKPIFDRLGCEPIYLRLRRDDAAQPVQQVRDEINRVLAERRIEGDPFGEGETLRDYFQPQKQGWYDAERKSIVPVLIFDQFEEFLTMDDADSARRPIEVFWTQMANLIGGRGRESTNQLQLPSFETGSGGTRFRVIFCLHQDHLPRLLSRRGHIPSIAQNHCVLKPIHGRKAVEVVLSAGKHLLDPVDATTLAERIVRGVASETTQSPEKAADVLKIEPLDGLRIDLPLLSFFCQQLNEARRRSQRADAGKGFITAQLIQAESGVIFEDFLQPGKGVRRTAAVVEPPATTPTTEQPISVPAVEPLTVTPVAELPPPAALAESKINVAEPELRIVAPTAEAPESVIAPEPETAIPHSAAQTEARQSELVSPIQTSEPPDAVTEVETQDTVHAPELQSESHPEPATKADVPQPQIPNPVIELELRAPAAQTPTVAKKTPEHVVVIPSKVPMPAPVVTRVERRLKNVLVFLGMVAVVAFSALVVAYFEELKRAQTEVELEEYISNLAAAKNTFQSAHKKLSLAESELALKESNLLALIEQTRQQEQETEAEKEKNIKLSGEQATYESRIGQLNRERAQAEARFAQWSSTFADLTNQMSALARQNDDLESRNHALLVNNRVLSATNAVLAALKNTPAPAGEGRVTNSSQSHPSTAMAFEENQAKAMAHFPEKTAAAVTMDSDSTHRNADVLLIHGDCLYSDGGVGLRPLELHHVLRAGASIQTGKNSWCDLFIRRAGTMVRLAPESQMKIGRLSLGTENGFPVVDTLLVLPHGRMFTIVRALVPGSTLEVSDGVERSVIEVGGLGSYMISAPAPDFGDKLSLTPLHLIVQQGANVLAPGQEYTARDGVVFSLAPSSWELTLLKLDEIEAEADKALAQQVSPKLQ